MSRFTGFSENYYYYFVLKSLKHGRSMGSFAISLSLEGIRLHWLFHALFGEIFLLCFLEYDPAPCSSFFFFLTYVLWNTILWNTILLLLLFFFWRLHYFLYIILKWRDVINWNSWFLATVKGFSKGLLLFKQIFFMKIKTDFNKSWYFMCQILTWEVLDPPTHSRQFDGNCGKIRYVRDP